MEQQSVTDSYNATNQLIVLDEHGNEIILSNIHHSQPIQNVIQHPIQFQSTVQSTNENTAQSINEIQN